MSEQELLEKINTKLGINLTYLDKLTCLKVIITLLDKLDSTEKYLHRSSERCDKYAVMLEDVLNLKKES